MPVWQIQALKAAIQSSPAGNVFQRKIEEIFWKLPNVSGIADDILDECYDDNEREYNSLLWSILLIHREESLKSNKDRCHFRSSSVPFWWNHFQTWCETRSKKSQTIDKDPLKHKKELQAFHGIINYLSKFSPSTTELCDSLWWLTFIKAEWTWNANYQRLFDKVKLIIKE